MVMSHPGCHLVATIVACFFLFTLHSDGAILYGQPRRLGYERHLETPSRADTVSLKSLNDITGDEGDISWGEADRGQPSANNVLRSSELGSSSSRSIGNSVSPSDHLQTISRPPPSSYFPERYVMVPPEESFLRELLLHSAAAADTRRTSGLSRDLGYGDYTVPRDVDDQFELKLPSVGSANGRDWTYQDNLPLYVKPKRLYQQLPQELQKGQAQSYYMRDTSLTEPRLSASKRWWGGYHRPRAQIDRRASQSKHYDCLKSCIKEGKLHPIQCHTLC